MRKFVVLLMCFILPFSLFAQGAAESGAADDQGKVIIFQSKVEITEALEDAAADFTEETGIEVEIWETTGDDYRAQLSLRLAGDEVPTIFTVAAGSEAEMFAPYIAPIKDSEVNQYISPSLALMVNGKSSGVPYSVEGYGLVINTDMVSEADLENDETFLTALDRLASEGVNPFGLSQESYFLIGHLLNAPFAIMEDPEGFLADFEAGNVHLADQEEFRIYYSENGACKKTNYELCSDATGEDAEDAPPYKWLHMGVPYPTQKLIITATRVPNDPDQWAEDHPDEDYEEYSADNTDNRVYVYTYVSEFGDIEEESAPSDPTEIVCDTVGGSVHITGFGDAPTDHYNITKVRLYRAVTGSSTTIYMLVDEMELEDHKFPESGRSLNGVDWADSTYNDTRTVAQLGKELDADVLKWLKQACAPL